MIQDQHRNQGQLLVQQGSLDSGSESHSLFTKIYNKGSVSKSGIGIHSKANNNAGIHQLA